ncbi:MAG: twin-arginine translocase TatA/TatE family subunit [Ignavibacteriae bacterium]|nr:twin-arginine translocase TatA/TatE family subunit [Ignavibacteria bacterium]MBI3364978.1 twin-arginine translocase TatA/TatE family subunit [Ignavibacteriota bacterium]
MFGNLGTPEIIIIGLIILVLFGAKRIPEFMQGLGKGVREFRKAARDVQNEIETPDTQKKPDDSSTTKH